MKGNHLAALLTLLATACDTAAGAGTDPEDASRPRPSPSTATSPWETPCTVTDDDRCRASMDIGGCRATFYRSHDLGAQNPAVRRAIIAVHGVDRAPTIQFGSILSAASRASPTTLAETEVIAPAFPERGETTDELGWPGNRYSAGRDGGCAASRTRVSSFAVADELIRRLADRGRFPHLTDVVVIGHSGGGQYVARFAAATRAPDAHPGLRFRFVPTNPSSWLYLDEHRYVEGDGWVADHPCFSGCGFNSYRYGLAGRGATPYVAALSDAELRSNFASRRVTYFVGEADTCNERLDPSCDDSSLDKACAAMIQGPNRLERARRYREYIHIYYPPSVPHDLVTVPGVGHSSWGMYGSEEGKTVLFEN